MSLRSFLERGYRKGEWGGVEGGGGGGGGRDYCAFKETSFQIFLDTGMRREVSANCRQTILDLKLNSLKVEAPT